MPQDKAPADHPEHPSQLGRPRSTETLEEIQADLDRWQRLIDKYRTPAELDAEEIPERAELERREELVLAAYEAQADDDPAALVVLVDLTGTTYRWVMDDNEPDHWAPEEPQEPEQPPAEQTGRRKAAAAPAPDLEAALAALDAAKSTDG